MAEKSFWKRVTGSGLLLPVMSLLLVMAVNIVFDILSGNNPFNFFMITLQQTTSNGSVLYGRIIDVLNRGSEAAILAIGMTLVVSSSAGTDGVSSTNELAVPLVVGVLGGILMGSVCGAFNGTLVAYFRIQPMVATLILYSAARAVGLLLCNDLIVYVRNSSYAFFGSFLGPVPTPIVITAVCVAVITILLKKSALGMYIQSVGINAKASRISGLNSRRIMFLTYVLCGTFAGIAGIVASSRITSADSNNIGLYLEMDAILAVALGGNSLGGGRFNLAGSIIGAYTIQAITTTLYALGVSTTQAPVFKAIIVILIVAVQSEPVRAYMKKRRLARAAREGGAV